MLLKRLLPFSFSYEALNYIDPEDETFFMNVYFKLRWRILLPKWFAVYTKTSFSDAMFTTTTRGKPAIRIGPYRFNRHSCCKGPKIRWLCQKWQMGCRASVFTYNSEIIAEKNEHNHWFLIWMLKCYFLPTYLVSIT